MPRRPRYCSPGSWHHVFNRGLARRSIFETDEDRSLFLAVLRDEVEEGRIRLHAYCLMENHFHLLVDTPTGELDVAMREVTRGYVKAFNRAHDRDGPLFRSRYSSKLIEDEDYSREVLCYIDRNPVAAGLVQRSYDFVHGSAWHFRRGTAPPWLTKSWVARVVASWTGVDGLPPGIYGEHAAHDLSEEEADVVEARLRHRGRTDPRQEWSDACGVARWLRQRAEVADGRQDDLPVAGRQAIRGACERDQAGGAQLVVDGSIAGERLWDVIEAGLLRDLARLPLSDIAESLDVSVSTASRYCRLHAMLVRGSVAYRSRVSEITWAIARPRSRR